MTVLKKGREEDGASLYSDQDADAARFTYEQGPGERGIAAYPGGESDDSRTHLGTCHAERHPAWAIHKRRELRIQHIVDPNTFMLVIDVQDLDLPRLREGQAALVRIDALDGQEFEAHIRRINPGIDPVSLTFRVTLDFDAENA